MGLYGTSREQRNALPCTLGNRRCAKSIAFELRAEVVTQSCGAGYSLVS